MNPTHIVMWAEIGGRLIKLGVGTYESIKAMLDAAPDVTVDRAKLEELHRDYQERLARAKAVVDTGEE